MQIWLHGSLSIISLWVAGGPLAGIEKGILVEPNNKGGSLSWKYSKILDHFKFLFFSQKTQKQILVIKKCHCWWIYQQHIEKNLLYFTTKWFVYYCSESLLKCRCIISITEILTLNVVEYNVRNHRTLLCCYLVESSSTSEDNVRIVHLNSSLSKPHQIGANPYGSASDL